MIVVYIIMIVIGIIPLWRVVGFIRLEERIRKHGVSTIAIVENIQTVSLGSTSRRVYLDNVCLKYQSRATGQWHQSRQRTKKGRYKRGEQLKVLYLEERPGKVIVQSSRREYWAGLFLCMAIVLLMAVAVYKIDQALQPGG